MRKLREWVLTLGVMAAAPAVGLAGPFSLPSLPFTQEKVSNQEVAEGIASSLQQARLQGTDIQIEFKGGVATLAGKVTDAGQKAKATQVVSQVSGVKTVDNRLQIQSARTPRTGGIQQATFFDGPAQPNFSPIRQVGAATPERRPSAPAPEAASPAFPQTAAAPANSNQEVAENIAGALGTAGLNGYDIQISYQDGTATLSGAVANPQQRLMAEQAATSVSGVKLVSNQLRLPAAPQTAAAPQMGPQRGPQMMAPPQSPYIPAGYQGQPGPPAGYGQPGAMASHTVHNSPNLPPHSYPTYGAYPNSAAVSYPKQYGASAFPYIGPFYPYPQVPLGWRKSTLEWKDGSWALDFDSKTDKWWWFMSPKNW